MEFVLGQRDGKRREVRRRTEVVNPHVDQTVQMHQVVCDLEISPGNWVVQVIDTYRIRREKTGEK